MLQYSLEVGICWAILYLIYIAFLRRETFFSINRWYLLSSLVLGLLIPVLRMLPSVLQEEVVVVNEALYFISAGPELIAANLTARQETESILNLNNLLLLTYCLGVLLVGSRFIIGLLKIKQLYATGSRTNKGSFTLVETNKFHLPFSFLNCVFFSKEMPINDNIEKILKHELTHVQSWHTLDVLFLEVLQVLFWFNPLIILYKKSIKESHEYVADASVLQDTSQKIYGLILLRQSQSGLQIALANHFFHSHIKKRITMMKQKKSKRPALIKYLFALPVILLLMVLFQSQTLLDENSKYSSSDAKQTALISNENISKELRKDFEDLYHTTDHYKNIEKTVNKFDDLLTSYLNRYPSSKESIKTTFQSMSRFMGIHIKYGGKNPAFDQFVFIVPDRLLKAFQAGELPEYSRLLDSRQSSENKIYGRRVETDSDFDSIPPVPPTAPILELLWQQLAENDKIHILIDGKQVTTQHAIALRGKIESSGGMTLRMNDQHKSIVDSLEIFTNINNIQSVEFDENKRPLELLGGNIVLTDANDKPLIVIDGIVQSNYFEVERNYTPGSVESLQAVSEEMARQKYGEKGKYGAIEVATKKAVEEIFKVVEQMPHFPGCENLEGSYKEREECGKENMLEFIYANLKYPDLARVNGVEGTNVVQFVVEKDGSLSEMNLVRDIGAKTGDETMKVMKKMQDEYIWTPGYQRGNAVRVQYTLPIRFKLADDEKCCFDKELGNIIEGDGDKKPLIIVDGEKWEGRDINLESDDIRKVSVLKGEAAIEKYGAKAQHGVVLVETKDGDLEVRSVTINNPNPSKVVEGEVYKFVEEMPRFPGCEESGGTLEEKKACAKKELLQFVYTHLNYPRAARDAGLDGTVVVQFVIDKTGQVINPKVMRDIEGAFEEPILAVINEMKLQNKVWTPGKQGGEPVNVLFTMPVKFVLEQLGVDKQNQPSQDVKKVDLEDPNEMESWITGLAPAKVLNISSASTLSNVTIDYYTDLAGPVTIAVYNTAGQLLKTEKTGVIEGKNTKSFTLSAGVSGIYIVSLTQENSKITRKIILN